MRVLISDDDRNVAVLLASIVTACNHEVVETITGGGLDTIRACTKHHPDLVLLDIMMPKYNGFTVCSQLMSRNPDLKVVLMSGMVDKDYPSVSTCGAYDFLRKPLHFERVRELLARAAD